MIGYKKLPKWLKTAYLKAVKNKCQDCGKSKELEIHRIIPGNRGGLYIPQNVKVLCKECHKNYRELYNERW